MRRDLGDRTFIELVDREHRGIVAAAAMIVGDTTIAEDIAQDALERAFTRWDRVGRLDRPGAWIRRVAINRSISIARRRSTERRAMDRVGQMGTSGHRTGAPGSSTDSSFDGTADQLWAAVRDLPESQATAVALHYGADLSMDSVAAEMGTSVSSVKSMLHRARTTLRNHTKIKELEETVR